MPYKSAYIACQRLLGLKKENDPKTLAMVLTHLKRSGQRTVDAQLGRERYKKKIERSVPSDLMYRLAEPGFLMQYLVALTSFLKAKSERGNLMRKYNSLISDADKSAMTNHEKVQFAMEIAEEFQGLNKNKHKRLAASIQSARDEYEALATMARFYSLQGISHTAIDKSVKYLENYKIQSVKDMITLAIIFYEAGE